MSEVQQAMAIWSNLSPIQRYWMDAWQRTILVLDVLRERGNQYFEHNASKAPNVLGFAVELVLDGRTLPRPVNYGLVRVVPPEGTRLDPLKPPFIIVDPRAGHGPGIGGMKADSEIGVALAAGHPCYFIGFLPDPVPGQTVEDVCRAEAAFVAEVAQRHPKAEGKPVIIANCQAGWQIMMMAATNPDLPGAIMLAGTPLSYWAGVRGKNPLRYLGRTLGGTWLTALSGDLGHGIFDGAHLVANFESLNPANTYWTNAYNVYSKVDTEASRFLDFETWWGSPVLLNAEEMQWIADNLFVGNKLATGELRTSDGLRIDLRNIKSSIIVFCSWGDNITPPQQALGWITDLYDSEAEIAANGQTIVYTLHQSIGHLGIFVSGKVASKEHNEFAASMEMIDLLPPGLYEAVLTQADEGVAHRELVQGQYLMTLEPRTLNDIRALGGNSEEDERCFATAARVSEVNHSLYRTLFAPLVQASATEQSARAMRQMHPNLVRFAMFSDQNPLMAQIKELAQAVRNARQPVDADNPFLAMERSLSSWIASSWDMWGQMRDSLTESMFLNAYGSPLVQAMVGLGLPSGQTHQRIERDLAREAADARLRSELTKRFEVGGLAEALARALIYVPEPYGSVDERGFAMFRAMRAEKPTEARLPWMHLKDLLRDQFLLLRLDQERAIRAIPGMLPRETAERRAALEQLHRVVGARGAMPEEGRRRLARVDNLFGVKAEKPASGEAMHA